MPGTHTRFLVSIHLSLYQMINSYSLLIQKKISTSSLHMYLLTCIFVQILYLISWYCTWKILLFFSLATFTSVYSYTIIYSRLIITPMSIMFFSLPKNLFEVLSYCFWFSSSYSLDSIQTDFAFHHFIRNILEKSPRNSTLLNISLVLILFNLSIGVELEL